MLGLLTAAWSSWGEAAAAVANAVTTAVLV